MRREPTNLSLAFNYLRGLINWTLASPICLIRALDRIALALLLCSDIPFQRAGRYSSAKNCLQRQQKTARQQIMPLAAVFVFVLGLTHLLGLDSTANTQHFTDCSKPRHCVDLACDSLQSPSWINQRSTEQPERHGRSSSGQLP